MESVPLSVPPGKVRAPSSSCRGLTYITASVFIVGEIAGSGILTLPKAMEGTGWIGILVITFSCLLSIFTGVTLSKDWTILQSRYSEYIENTHHPYPTLGQITYGKVGRYLVSFCINFSLFGACVVFLLLSASILSTMVVRVGTNLSICDMLLVIGGVLIPVSWFGTPKDFWPLAAVATLASACGMVIVLVLIALDIKDNSIANVQHRSPDFKSFFSAFGVFVYAFGGHSVFLTIQADMQVKKHFSKSLYMGYGITFLIYLPVALCGYLVYGDRLSDNVLDNISPSLLLNVMQVTIFIHLIIAFIILLNPVSQELEGLLSIPKDFNRKRCIARTLLVLSVIFVAASVPNFGSILALIGSSTITLLSFIFPSLFYLKLAKQTGPWKPIEIPLHIKTLHYENIVVGIFVAASATYSSLDQIANQNFVWPCYLKNM